MTERVSLLTVPTGGGVESYVNTVIEGSWILVHTPSVVQLTDVNIMLDALRTSRIAYAPSFQVRDAFGNLIQERVVDPSIVLR